MCSFQGVDQHGERGVAGLPLHEWTAAGYVVAAVEAAVADSATAEIAPMKIEQAVNADNHTRRWVGWNPEPGSLGKNFVFMIPHLEQPC